VVEHDYRLVSRRCSLHEFGDGNPPGFFIGRGRGGLRHVKIPRRLPPPNQNSHLYLTMRADLAAVTTYYTPLLSLTVSEVQSVNIIFINIFSSRVEVTGLIWGQVHHQNNSSDDEKQGSRR
jgi:hypothetical protein